MGEFTAVMVGIALVVWMSVSVTTFRFDANQTNKMLTETCQKNSGIESSKVDVDNWYFTCKDGAKFQVKR